MADRRALVIAVEKSLDPAFGPVPYAEAGARALADALAGAGYPTANQVHLFGSHATLTIIKSRLRRLLAAAKAGDELLVYYAGRAADAEGIGHLCAWDTQADDLAETGLNVRALAELSHAGKASQVTLFIDAAGTDGLTSDLADVTAASPKLVALTSSSAADPSHAAAGLKATVWTHLLIEAFAGRAPKAVTPAGTVTAVSLQRHIEDDMPRLLRRHFDTLTQQDPRLYGDQNGAAVIADLAHLKKQAAGGLLSADRLQRVVFRTDSHGRVKDLTGFRKTFTVPDNNSPSNRKFIARLAAPDIKTDLDAVVAVAREHLDYKRKDIDLIADGDGVGTVRTPDFEYTVRADLDKDDPSRVAWRREVGSFTDPAFVRGAGFDAVFGKLFDQLAFEFAHPIEVDALIDRLEDSPPKGVKINVAADGGACDITLAGFVGRVVVDRTSLTVRGRAGNAAGLLDQFLAFVGTVGPLGEPLMLA